jgi:hypothetical protein
VTSFLLSIDVDWPLKLDDILDFNFDITNPSNLLVPFECNLIYSIEIKINIYFKKIIVTAIVCLVVPLLILAFWLVLAKWKKYSSDSLKPKIIISYIVFFFTYQPSFVNQFIGCLICKEIEGQYYLFKNLNEACWSQAHRNVTLFLIFPFLLLLMVLIPGIFILRMKKLSDAKIPFDSYSFFSSCYKDEFYYWDFVLMNFKYSLIIMITFIRDIKLLAFIFSPITIILIYFQIIYQPYRYTLVNKLAIFARFANFTTVIYLIFLLISPGHFLSSIFIAIFLGVNFSFLLYYFVLYYSMNKNVMVCFHKIFSCFDFKSFYIDKETGSRKYFDRKSEVIEFGIPKLFSRLYTKNDKRHSKSSLVPVIPEKDRKLSSENGVIFVFDT